jgi:hypothetical protein
MKKIFISSLLKVMIVRYRRQSTEKKIEEKNAPVVVASKKKLETELKITIQITKDASGMKTTAHRVDKKCTTLRFLITC